MKNNPDSLHFGDSSKRLSQTGQMLGWAVFGVLVLAGFFFGIVTGYEPPKKNAVARAPKENPKPTEKADTKGTPDPKPGTQPATQESPKEEITPKADSPKADPPKENPPKIDPPKIESPPKKEEPKKEDLKPVVFKDVLPILRTHCLNCHGAGSGKPKGDVNLTSIANMMKSRGKLLVPGRPNESDLYTSITEREMPDGGRPKPKVDELMKIRLWIEGGAKPRRRKLRSHRR
jgi:hypothetical protein